MSLSKPGVILGLLSFPFKLRPGRKHRTVEEDSLEREIGFSFSPEINIEISAGLRWKLSRIFEHYLAINAGYGIGSINVDPLEFDYETRSSLESIASLAVFTQAYGMIYQYRFAQVGFFVGFDYLSGDIGQSWVYQGKPWYSIGIGFGIIQSRPFD